MAIAADLPLRSSRQERKPLYKIVYVQDLIAIAFGIDQRACAAFVGRKSLCSA
jgi:hypothetical protein